MMPESQKEQFNNAYLRAITAVAGYTLYKPELDDDSIDWGICARGANKTPRAPRMELQLKCTARDVLHETHLRFPQSRQFSEMLADAIRRLQNRSLETAQIIAELVRMAKEMREAAGRGERLGLSEDEITKLIAYLDTLAAQSEAEQRRLGKPRLTVVVLDNASFHRGEAVRAREPVWAEKGMLLRYLPPYCPMLNRIETTWRVLKGFLMPRRCYDTVVELRTALLIALKALGATII